NLFTGLEKAEDEKNIQNIPKDLPILIFGGGDDPVGNFGEGPKKVAEIYRASGIHDVDCKIYPGDRHEVLNEIDHEVADRDLIAWILQRI
ncbi:MAG: alpha/beta hydrolase, partial [Eubacterium sp.]|nr:alpha/beta hydrolase [Eubacterium sp.]